MSDEENLLDELRAEELKGLATAEEKFSARLGALTSQEFQKAKQIMFAATRAKQEREMAAEHKKPAPERTDEEKRMAQMDDEEFARTYLSYAKGGSAVEKFARQRWGTKRDE